MSLSDKSTLQQQDLLPLANHGGEFLELDLLPVYTFDPLFFVTDMHYLRKYARLQEYYKRMTAFVMWKIPYRRIGIHLVRG